MRAVNTEFSAECIYREGIGEEIFSSFCLALHMYCTVQYSTVLVQVDCTVCSVRTVLYIQYIQLCTRLSSALRQRTRAAAYLQNVLAQCSAHSVLYSTSLQEQYCTTCELLYI